MNPFYYYIFAAAGVAVVTFIVTRVVSKNWTKRQRTVFAGVCLLGLAWLAVNPGKLGPF